MAFNAAVKLTNAGKEMLAQGQLGTPLRFTRFVMGSGNTALPPEAMTDVVTPVLDLPIKQKIDRGGGEIYIRTDYTNQVITEAFYYRELGVYADQQSNETDPVTNERLYCYGNAGALAELIQPQTGISTLEKIVGLTIGIGNAETVILNIDPSIAYVPVSEYAAHKHTGTDGTERVSFDDLDAVPDEVSNLAAKQQEQDGAIATLETGQTEQGKAIEELEASQERQDEEIEALQEGIIDANTAISGLQGDRVRSMTVTLTTSGWTEITEAAYPVPYARGARYMRQLTFTGILSTYTVIPVSIPTNAATHQYAKDAGVVTVDPSTNAIAVFIKQIPAGSFTVQFIAIKQILD